MEKLVDECNQNQLSPTPCRVEFYQLRGLPSSVGNNNRSCCNPGAIWTGAPPYNNSALHNLTANFDCDVNSELVSMGALEYLDFGLPVISYR